MGLNRVEWPTLALIAACYGVWALGTVVLPGVSGFAAILVTGCCIGLFSSLQHEVLHGHPFRNAWANEALVFPSLTLWVPYIRFRDTHLDHHYDARLTDPFDDPEANFLAEGDWQRCSGLRRALLSFNNRLLGRLTIGALIGQITFMAADWRAIRAGDRRVLKGWLWHIPSVGLVGLWLVYVGEMGIWAYLLASYIGLSLLKIRTFLEHQAHEHASARSVVIEDRGLLAFLFLNNNFHSVHHMHPKVPWYRLPKLYFSNRERYLARNDGYMYPSYRAVFRRYFLAAKDPVAHPLWHRGDEQA